jgi:dephospho-CoA kinase
LNEQWEKIIQATPDKVVIFDIPLLFEAHLDSNFDIVLLVYAPPDTQVHRLMDREMLSPEQAVKTLSFQLPIDSKKAMADVVIDNSEDLDTTFRQVKSVWERLNSS